MKKSVFSFYQNYSFLIAAILAFIVVRFVLGFSDYFALIIANVACLGFFQAFDFKSDLLLEDLRRKQNDCCEKSDHIPIETSLFLTKSKQIRLLDQDRIIADLKPNYFFRFSNFVQAFNLRYLTDDTDKFISSFSEKLKMQFYSNVVAMLILLIIFKPSADKFTDYQDLLDNPAEVAKVAVTISGTVINLLVLIRPYLYYRERNRTLINN